MSRLTKNSQKSAGEMDPTLQSTMEEEQEPTWLKNIYKKLESLDSIANIQTQVSEIHTGMANVNTAIEGLTTTLNNVVLKNATLENKLSEFECENEKLKNELSDMKSQILYMESQSRRNNLIFDGVEENENETWEVTEGKIIDILARNLDIENANLLMIERAHRLGKKKAVNVGQKTVKPRQIIVKFSHFKDRQRIWLNKTKLKGKPVKIFEDYPEQIRSNRQTLWPYYQAARSLENFTSVSLNQDKLFLNNKLYTVKNLHEIPECLKPEKRAVKSNDDTIVFFSKHSIFSNFHRMPVRIEGQTYQCNEQYFQRAKAVMFNDAATAEKIMNESDPVKMSNLGKSVKGFKKELWAKQAPRVLHRVNTAKYEQNESAKRALLETGTKKIGEASPHTTYGTGVHINAKNALEHLSWEGENLMGQILTRIRETMTQQDTEESEFQDTNEFVQSD